MRQWLRAGATLSVRWDDGLNEYEAILFDRSNNTLADGNGRNVEEAIENCAANIDDVPMGALA